MDQPLPYRPSGPSPELAPTPPPPPPPNGRGPWRRPDPENEPAHWARIPKEKRLRAALVLAGAVLIALFAWLSWALPIGRSMQPLETPAFIFVSADGKPFARKGFVKDEPVKASDLPDHVKDAFISIEDRRFYRHLGVDLRAIARALRANQQAGEVVEGGSTITQQLAKTAFLDSRQTLRRKAQEALIALWLEVRLSKDEILSRYLSAVYFGDGVYGLRSAARHYFNKTPDRLTVQEAAMLAGLLKAPSRLAPTSNRKAAVERYRVVLAAM
ncbi:MAG TPA: biosynthetic peptidoglycan transglycosylase, partial [Caulobacteraceae bacterium]|nr:biosynthetic peptidoglycan transglycosylase [Caulobacteraceae bacterium]